MFEIENTKVKISSGQLLSLLICSRITVTLTYSLNNNEHYASSGDWLCSLMLFPFLLLLAVPFFILFKQNRHKSLLDRAYDISCKFGNVISLIYGIYFMLIPITSVSRFTAFVTSTIQTERDMSFYAILIMIPVCYAAIKGLQPIARAGSIAVVIGGIILLTITIILIPRFNPLYITCPIFEDKSNMYSMLKILISNCNEIVLLLIIFPSVKSNVKRSYLLYSVLSCVIITVILFTITATLGAYAKLQAFPYYTAYGIAELGSLKRLDAIHSAVWLLGVFIKACLFTYASHLCLERILPHKLRTISIIIISTIIIITASIVTRKYDNFSLLFGANNLLRGLLSVSIVIPVLIIVLSYFKQNKRKKKLI